MEHFGWTSKLMVTPSSYHESRTFLLFLYAHRGLFIRWDGAVCRRHITIALDGECEDADADRLRVVLLSMSRAGKKKQGFEAI